MVTPLIATLRKDGGTLYTFSSAARDLTRVFTDSRYSFSFSHFACLNLPDFRMGTYEDNDEDTKPMEKGTYLNTLISEEDFQKAHYDEHASHNIYSDSECVNMLLAENLQNYVLNFETAIWEGMGDNDDYDTTQLRTVAERVFFNWLQKIGAIEFKNANDEEVLMYDVTEYIEGRSYLNSNTGKYEFQQAEFDDRLVKYIGKIDIINSVDVSGDAYDEIYLHIPGSVGGSDVKFFSVYDNNYDITKPSFVCEDSESIIGRENLYKEGNSPYDLSLKAIYDDNDKCEYTIDSGYCIDFRESTYDGIMSMNQNSQKDFEFNCVLLYYTMKDTATGDSVTNLYGVLFLEEITLINTDDVSDTSTSISRGYIQRYPKIAGGENDNGNSYALKVDIKIDTLPDTTMTAREYNDANGDYAGALEIYTQALLQIQSLATKLLEDKQTIVSLQERVEYLENKLSLINQIPTIQDDIESLNDYITYEDTVVNGQNLLDLIEANTTKLNAIINGKTSAKITVDSSAIGGGYGINVTGDDDGYITIDNKIASYSISYFYSDADLTDDNMYSSTNYLSLSNTNAKDIIAYTGMDVGSNIAMLYVKDTCNTDFEIHVNAFDWKTGQSLRILVISGDDEFTGASTKGDGSTAVPILKIVCEDSDGNNMYLFQDTVKVKDLTGLYEIEIICVDATASEASRKFIYDIKTR